MESSSAPLHVVEPTERPSRPSGWGQHSRVAAADEFRETLGALGIAQSRIAKLFNVGPRSVRRWQYGDRRIPRGVSIVFRLLAAKAVTIDQVERAAFPVPARTNGDADPGPPAPLFVASASLPFCAETTTFVDSGPTLAEKVYALA